MSLMSDSSNGETRGALTEPPPPLDSKESRTAMNKILNAVEDLSDDQRARVLRAACVLYGVRL